MPSSDSNSEEMTGIKGKRGATKCASWIEYTDVVVHGQHLKHHEPGISLTLYKSESAFKSRLNIFRFSSPFYWTFIIHSLTYSLTSLSSLCDELSHEMCFLKEHLSFLWNANEKFLSLQGNAMAARPPICVESYPQTFVFSEGLHCTCTFQCFKILSSLSFHCLLTPPDFLSSEFCSLNHCWETVNSESHSISDHLVSPFL